MSALILKNRTGKTITTWANGRSQAKPEHWKEGRSAMELARAWFTSSGPACPPEIQSLLDANPHTKGTVFDEGFPEHVTGLPHGINGRHHDLMLRGRTKTEKITVCVEVKADEPFGDHTIGEYWRSASDSTTPTNAPKRIKALLEIVFGAAALPDQKPWSDVRYQLLTAVAGTAIQAASDNAPLAVFIVHEFQTSLTTPARLAANDDDYKAFVAQFCSVPASRVVNGHLYGPVRLHYGENPKYDIDVLVGKAVRVVKAEPAGDTTE